MITNLGTALLGSVKEDNALQLIATGQLSASDVDHNAIQTWTLDHTQGSYGSMAVNASTGLWTYTLDTGSVAVQALKQGESHNEIFNATVTDDKGASVLQRINVTVNGTNDVPVIAAATKQFQQGQAATVNLFNISTDTKVSDVDGLTNASGVLLPDEITSYSFATHEDGDADYSQFTIDSVTGQIDLTATGAQAIAADAVRTDYMLHVQAQDKFGGVSLSQAIDIHVNMAVNTENHTASLPGAMSDWDIEPILKPDEKGESSVSDGYLMINHADPLIAIRVPANVPLLNFSDGTQLTLSNSATSATGTITDTSTDVSKNHFIKIADGTTENTIIELLPNGKYTITGASDTVVDPALGPATNFRSDTLMVNVIHSQANFTKVGNNLQMVINANGATGTVLMNEIEAIHFSDDVTVLVAATAASNLSTEFNSFNGFYSVNGSPSLDDAYNYKVAHPNPNDTFVPLSDVYHF